jgi:hypothetical protein
MKLRTVAYPRVEHLKGASLGQAPALPAIYTFINFIINVGMSKALLIAGSIPE